LKIFHTDPGEQDNRRPAPDPRVRAAAGCARRRWSARRGRRGVRWLAPWRLRTAWAI